MGPTFLPLTMQEIFSSSKQEHFFPFLLHTRKVGMLKRLPILMTVCFINLQI